MKACEVIAIVHHIYRKWEWYCFCNISEAVMNVWDKCLTACLCGCITGSLIDHVCILSNPAGETAPSLLFEHISPVPRTECWIPWDDVRGHCCPATQDSSRDGETSSLSQEVKCLFSYHRDDTWVIFCLFILVKILQCQHIWHTYPADCFIPVTYTSHSSLMYILWVPDSLTAKITRVIRNVL